MEKETRTTEFGKVSENLRFVVNELLDTIDSLEHALGSVLRSPDPVVTGSDKLVEPSYSTDVAKVLNTNVIDLNAGLDKVRSIKSRLEI